MFHSDATVTRENQRFLFRKIMALGYVFLSPFVHESKHYLPPTWAGDSRIANRVEPGNRS
jgi:hypothetical protein